MSEPIGHWIPVTPTGEHAEIDLTAQRTALAALSDPERRERAVREVLATPSRFAPPILYALATALFDGGRHEEGAVWFYAAQLRTRFDVRRCADPTVADVPVLLRERHGPPINRWAFAETGRLRSLVERAVEWDRAIPHDYDQRWINLHGMGAFRADGTPLSLPRDGWDELAERTRVEYLDELDRVLGG